MIAMEREVNQCIWETYMDDLGVNPDKNYENDTFCVRAYSWADVGDENDWHFWHKPSRLKIQWYKYPLRGCMWNIPLTHEGFAEVLKDCHNSMQDEEKIKFLYDCIRWWEDDEDNEW